MNTRVLRTELRRSAAPWAGALVLVSALGFLYLLPANTSGPTSWTAQWTTMAMRTRGLLFWLWPLVVGLGALQGLRDHRSGMTELLATTPRPAHHRAAVLSGAAALTLTAASALVVLVGGVQVLGNTEYTHLGWLPISLVGLLALVGGAVLGTGLGRALPSALTPPAVTVTAFVFTVLIYMSLGRTETTLESGVTVSEPTRLSLFSPVVGEVRHFLLTLSAPVHAGQTIWFLGMAATGFGLLIATTLRSRLIALAPLVAGAVLALLVLPSDPRRIEVVDEAAAAWVCDGPVCVTTAHRPRLDEIAGPGQEALRLMQERLGDRAPDSVREMATVPPDGTVPKWSRDTVLFDFEDDVLGPATDRNLPRALIAKAMVPGCVPAGWQSFSYQDDAARIVAVAWFTGDLKELDSQYPVDKRAMDLARPAWEELRALPPDRQLARIEALRTAGVSCKGEPFEALTGGASQ